MTYEQYLEEHGSDPVYDEPLVIGECEYCGQEVLENEPHYEYQGCLIHVECASEFIESEFPTEYVAEALGLVRK